MLAKKVWQDYDMKLPAERSPAFIKIEKLKPRSSVGRWNKLFAYESELL